MILSRGRPPTGSHRPPVDVPINDFGIFAPPVKSKNRYLIEGLLLSKYYFIVKLSIFLLVPGGYPEDIM